MPRMRHGRPKYESYPSKIPLTQLQSHLPIYNPTYPSKLPLTQLQSHLQLARLLWTSSYFALVHASKARVAAVRHVAARPARHLEATWRAPCRWSRRLRPPAGFHPARPAPAAPGRCGGSSVRPFGDAFVSFTPRPRSRSRSRFGLRDRSASPAFAADRSVLSQVDEEAVRMLARLIVVNSGHVLHPPLPRPCRGLGPPLSAHICAGTRPTPPTSAPGLGSPRPHLHRDWAHPCHACAGALGRPLSVPICTGTRLTWPRRICAVTACAAALRAAPSAPDRPVHTRIPPRSPSPPARGKLPGSFRGVL
jgi:hypothetical protein